MVSQSDVFIGALRRRRYRLRRLIRLRVTLGHGTEDMRPVALAYMRVGLHIRRSLQRSERVRAVEFNLNVFSQQEALTNYRFLVSDMGRLSAVLSLNVDMTRCRYHVTRIECLAIILCRLASPCRWTDLALFFGRSASALSEIFFRGAEELLAQWGHLLTTWRAGLMTERAPVYAHCITGMGALLHGCVGFIDGTAIRVVRPGGGLQRACYSGHKRCHAIKFQSICAPDGLFSTGRLRCFGMTCSRTTSRVSMHTSRRRFSMTIHSIASMETLPIFFVYGCSVDTVHGLTVTQGNRNTMEL